MSRAPLSYGLASLWIAAGCLAKGAYPGPAEPVDIARPSIAAFSLDCDPDAGLWTLTAAATSWTGGGSSAWSQDLVYIESHDIDAVASAPDAAGEDLRLVLDIVSDWRLQASGKSTVFTCADDPTVAFNLLDVSGEIVDCRIAGPLAEQLAPEIDCEVWVP